MVKQKKLKICHVITRMIVGGAQENTLLSIVGQIEKGHDVTLITGHSPGPEGELLENSDFISKYNIKIIKTPHLVRSIDPVRDILAYFYLKNVFLNEKFDVVHTHSSKAGIIGRAAACKAKISFIAHTIHGQAFHPYEKPWRNWIYKKLEYWAAKRCHIIFAVAKAMITQCMDAHISRFSKYKVVYSGMDLEPFLSNVPDATLRKKLGIPEDSPVVGTVARLFPLKGYEYFIPAAERIVKKYPCVRFLVVGNGILKEKIEKEISDLGMNSNFVFVGLIPPDEIYKYISLMDVVAHLSLREGLPRTVVQALASGKPAVGFDLDGTPEVIINGKTGCIAQPKDVESVTNAILNLLDKPELAKKMGENGRKWVKDKFAWKRMVNILEDEYYKGLEQYKNMWK